MNSSPARPSTLVDPRIDTGKPRVRWVFSASACRPFGMVRLSPDTDMVGTWAAGYRYFSPEIHCFSHVHAWQLSALPVMPVTKLRPGVPQPALYASRFSHDEEIVRPGYHNVLLSDSNIRAELTSTARVGFHRYTFPDSASARVLFYLGAALGPCEMSDTLACRSGPAEIEGFVENAPTRRRPKPCRIYFVVRFDAPLHALAGWSDRGLSKRVDRVAGPETGLVAEFAPGTHAVAMKVGLSYTGVGGARANIDGELGHWNFDRVADDSAAEWDRWLGRIQVEGATRQDRVKFYTDLWRSLMGGYLTSDADGSYTDRTGPEPVVRRVAPDPTGRPSYRRLEGDIFWGAHWSLGPLWGLAYPRVVHDWCNTLTEMGREGGLIPRGPSGGNYTFVMIGAHSTAFLAAAFMKGIRTFDVQSAFDGMRRNAFPGGLMSKGGYEHTTCAGGGVESYIERGYIPDPRKVEGAFHVDGASQTLEYAYDDWCLSQLASELGHDEDAELFAARSRNYRNLFDPTTRFMRPRAEDGRWLEPFDPVSTSPGWCEATAWHYRWWVPHDVAGLIELMGGPKRMGDDLDRAFETASEIDFYVPKTEGAVDRTDPRALVNYGNEPGRYPACLFNHLGRPWLTQKWSRRVRRQTFGLAGPRGFCEDDDNGLAAGTSVLLAIGLFDLQGGAARRPVYDILTPLFDRITIALDPTYHEGERFVIEARNNGPANDYIQRATLNGRPLSVPKLSHTDYVQGGHLVLQLGPQPCTGCFLL